MEADSGYPKDENVRKNSCWQPLQFLDSFSVLVEALTALLTKLALRHLYIRITMYSRD